ncbi:glycosyltransferase family 2 protein [Paraburkholderia terrae]|uniref:glycosyltransferase n=1 Tax=Paraburkholderia terrae TaxID=311230 RepID=UPI001EE2C383|nr:glycosyltransferase [Paraburkholderia terrae]
MAGTGHAAAVAGDCMQFDISVVVPTYKRPAMLEVCLRALAVQDYNARRYEVIICDDGPDDATRAAVESFAQRVSASGLTVRYVPVSATQGPAAARNAGWRAARSPLIAFTDDDTIPDPHWLTSGVAALATGADAACGRIDMPLPAAPSDYELNASGLTRADFATANAFVRRASLIDMGGFDERFTSAWREDSDLQFALLRTGGRIVRAAHAVVVHPVRPARWGVSLSQQKKSLFEALLFAKHPMLYRQRIAAGPPWRYYAIVVSLLFACGAALARHGTGAALALLIWSGLTAWLCVDRLRHTRRDPAHIAEMTWTSMLIPFLSIYWRLRGAIRYKVFFL